MHCVATSITVLYINFSCDHLFSKSQAAIVARVDNYSLCCISSFLFSLRNVSLSKRIYLEQAAVELPHPRTLVLRSLVEFPVRFPTFQIVQHSNSLSSLTSLAFYLSFYYDFMETIPPQNMPKPTRHPLS